MTKWGYKLKPSDVDNFFGYIDTDGTGELDYDEFLAHIWDGGATSHFSMLNKGTAAQAMKAFQTVFYTNYKSLHDAFLHFDAGRDRFLDIKELRTMADHCGVSLRKEEVEKLMEHFDVDGDGKISFSDFGATMQETFYGNGSGQAKFTNNHRNSAISAAQMNAQKKEFVYSYANLLLALRRELTGDGPTVQAKQKKFAELDKDKDGNVSKTELADMIRYFGFNLTSPQVDDFFSYMDTDESGTIEFHEFMTQVEGKGASKLITKAGKQAAMEITKMIANKFGAKGTDLTAEFNRMGLNRRTQNITFAQLHKALAAMQVQVSSAQLRPLFALYSAPDHGGTDVFHLEDLIAAMELAMPKRGEGETYSDNFSLESPRRARSRQGAWDSESSNSPKRPDSKQGRRAGGGSRGGRSLRSPESNGNGFAKGMGAEVREHREEHEFKDAVHSLEHELLGKMGRNNWQRMLTIFRKCDTDKSGFLGPIEFRQALREFDMPMNKQDFQVLWKTHMQEGVNQVNYRDFVRHFIVTLKLNEGAARNVKPGEGRGLRQDFEQTGPGMWAVQYQDEEHRQRRGQRGILTLPGTTGERELRAREQHERLSHARKGNQPSHSNGNGNGRSRPGPGMREQRGGQQIHLRSRPGSRSNSRPSSRSSVGSSQIVLSQPIQLSQEQKQQIASKWKSIRKTCQDIDKDRKKTVEARDMLAVLLAFGVNVTVQDIMKLPGKGRPGPSCGIRYNELVKACLQR
jgi:Ca2+-binding EF-hand superfamily protein